MIPYDLDPSLHGGEPERPLLDDGFSPPQQPESDALTNDLDAPTDPALWAKSEF